MLVNAVLTNVEVWHNISLNEIKEFDNLDKLFFRKLLGVPFSTPGEAFYLELGVLTIDVVIKAKRIKYLHNILIRKNKGMFFSFLMTQWNQLTKGDFTEQVKEDLKDFDIPISFEHMQAKSKDTFNPYKYGLKILVDGLRGEQFAIKIDK